MIGSYLRDAKYVNSVLVNNFKFLLKYIKDRNRDIA